MGVTLSVLTHACIFILIEKFLWNVKKINSIYQPTDILCTRPRMCPCYTNTAYKAVFDQTKSSEMGHHYNTSVWAVAQFKTQ